MMESTADTPSPKRTYALRALGWIFIAAVVAISIAAGMHLRWWVFNMSDPIRFIDDTGRGSYWGLLASGKEGYFNQYDKMEPEVPEWEDQQWIPWLDYGPLRLLVMREWGAWQRAYHPPDSDDLFNAWQRSYWFNRPVLYFNMSLEAFAAVMAFFLTRLWVLRGTAGETHGHFHGTWQGLIAALTIWFSADIIISAHAWFQWDSWAVPWYLCACLLASLDWWFAAGIAVAIGVNLKGQMMAITPIFIIWPLVQGRYGGSLRWICGMALGMAAIVSGWMISYIPADKLSALRDIQATMAVMQYPPDLFNVPRVFDAPAIVWILEMLIAAAVVPFLLRILMPVEPVQSDSRWKTILRSPAAWLAAAVIFIMAMVYWPWFLQQNRPGWYFGILAGAALAAAALFLPKRAQPYVLATVLSGGLLACMGLFHGGTGWWLCAYHYGSVHWPYMVTGPTPNIPAVFEFRFGWPENVDSIAFTLPAAKAHWPRFFLDQGWWPAAAMGVTSKMLFNSIYGVMLVISGIAIGLQARRNDRRMLVALVTPWIMFFLFPVQVQERYLLYASGAAACCIGDSWGAWLLGIMVMTCSAIMHMIRLLDWPKADLDAFGQNLATAFPHIFSPQSGQMMLQYLQPLHPDLAWGVLLLGLIFLYMSWIPSRRKNQPKIPTNEIFLR